MLSVTKIHFTISGSLKMQMEFADVQRKTTGDTATVAAAFSESAADAPRLSRKRVQFTAEQVSELELSYQQRCRSGRGPSGACSKLAGRLGLQLGQVKTWIKNRRARNRNTGTGIAAKSKSNIENPGPGQGQGRRKNNNKKKATMKNDESNFPSSNEGKKVSLKPQYTDIPSIRSRLRLRPAESKFSRVSEAPAGAAARAGGAVIPVPAMPVFFTQQFEPVFKKILADAPDL